MIRSDSPTPPKQIHPPTREEWQALQIDPKPWKKLWKPKRSQSSNEQHSIFWGRQQQPSQLKAGAIFLGFLFFFLFSAAGIAHWQTGFLGLSRGPSYGKGLLLSNIGFQTFHYEAGEEIWITYRTEIKEGHVNISIWTSDGLFSWNMIDKVFEYEVVNTEENELTWTPIQSGYYRIVVGSGKGRMPDLYGDSDRRYSVKWGLQKPT